MTLTSGRRNKGPRTIAVVGPYQSGKTTLLEALLFRAGAISRQGKTSDKTSAGDTAPEARAHMMGVELNCARLSFIGETFDFVDCPGSVEFSEDARVALPACDAAIVVCESDIKKAPALQVILKQIDMLGIPRILFLNKVDKSEVGPRELLSWLQPVSEKPLVLRQLPIMKNGLVNGFVDLALERAHIYQELAESKVVDLPADIADLEKTERFSMLEKLADHDDELMEMLLSEMSPTKDRIFDDLSREMAEGKISPVLFGSAEHGNGIGRLLKTLRHDVPEVEATAQRLGLAANAPPTAQVIKTIHTTHGGKLSIARVFAGEISDGATVIGAKGKEQRVAGVFTLMGQAQTKVPKALAGELVAFGRLDVIQSGETIAIAKSEPLQLSTDSPARGVYGFAISVADRKDEVKLTSGVQKLIEEDQSFSLQHVLDTHQMVLWGQGEMHLRVGLERLANKFGIQAIAKPRQIAYKETIKKPLTIRGRHKKQSGGHGQYGDVVVNIKPLARGEGFVFSDSVTGGVVPKQYIPAVEAGIREWMGRGPLGFPVVDFGVNLQEGSYHDVDSSEMAFKLAARLAMNDGMPQCAPVLLEPIVLLEIHVPSDATPRVNQIVSGHRGQLLGYDARAGWSGWDTVKAHMPESEIASLIIELRSATAGVGTFTYQFDHMMELGGRAADQVVAAHRAEAA
jgi:elongation factor G